MISLSRQADACELEALNIKGWLDTVQQPGRRPRTPEEITLRQMQADALNAAARTLRWLDKNEAAVRAAVGGIR